MHNTRPSWLPAARGADWFRLNRHDDPEPADPPEPSGDPDPVEPDPEPEGADSLGDKGKQALDRMKAERAEAKKIAAAEKKRADDLARKVAEFEDRDKSELDKATDKAQRLAEQAARATKRAVLAEVRAAASAFADPEDAAAFLDLASYAGDDGEIDTDTIAADLEALLARKPHLRRPPLEPPKPPAPKPDPGQGPRPDDPPADFRTATRDELQAELARSVPGFRLR
ncbi:hypothetical protein HYE82_03615 [Streptomyces sp. BR123]|uniref:hypothetical protein n=1 Tax=Streptomyces sp. BR123 TaxID=2749828 RepID=UPI0015C4CC5D|nr:hypothetical protein [Streptomyces sp. BR123]NXY93510.1 hypothetical protein [Streptomyces sp. BR123]